MSSTASSPTALEIFLADTESYQVGSREADQVTVDLGLPEIPGPQPVRRVYSISSPTRRSASDDSSGSSLSRVSTSGSNQSAFTAATSTSSARSDVSGASTFGAPLPPQAIQIFEPLTALPVHYSYRIPCEHKFLGCELEFHPEEVDIWIDHSFSHFGNHPPPPLAICTVCDERVARFESSVDRNDNWRSRMLHISSHGEELCHGPRPDFHLIDYMRSIEKLSQEDYEAANQYDERPLCRGLALQPKGFQTPEAKKRAEHEARREARRNIEVVDIQREERVRRRAEQNGSQTRQTRTRPQMRSVIVQQN